MTLSHASRAAPASQRGSVTFWYGCNVLRHGDLIHGCIDILKALGFDVRPVGGPNYCCGTVKDANQTAAEGMASRTASRFNELEPDRVVAWCPSCLSHMTEFTQQAFDTNFSLVFTSDVLYEHREELKKLLRHPVNMRVLIHNHLGFNDKSQVNNKVPALIKLIPGVTVIDDDYVAPGDTCAQLSHVPDALKDMFAQTRLRIGSTNADSVVTIFHQCYRGICGLEAEGGVKAFNYIHLLARSMGIERPDEYKAWKLAGANATELIDVTRLQKVGIDFFKKAILPELQSRPIYTSLQLKDD